MSNQTISCPDIDTMATMIAKLVKAGLTFEADAATLKITLTGGY